MASFRQPSWGEGHHGPGGLQPEALQQAHPLGGECGAAPRRVHGTAKGEPRPVLPAELRQQPERKQGPHHARPGELRQPPSGSRRSEAGVKKQPFETVGGEGAGSQGRPQGFLDQAAPSREANSWALKSERAANTR